MLAMGDEAVASAQTELAGENIEIIPALFGDIWLRDTAPIFTHSSEGLNALAFRFNGWGGKYVLPHDDAVAAFVAKTANAHLVGHDVILEGGSVDFDGAGSVLTTKECLLNANRNQGLSQQDIEQFLRQAFDVTHIVWLDRGLAGDHTDGHVDNIARFVAKGRVVCPSPSGKDDPNADTYGIISSDLRRSGLEVIQVPSPGLITDEDGNAVAASHMNFIIGNAVVVVPAYEDVYSKEAVRILTPLFPDRKVIALPARHILTGGGSFHCITQQEPAA